MDSKKILFCGSFEESMDEKFRIVLKKPFCADPADFGLRSVFLLAACPKEKCVIGVMNGHLPFTPEENENLSPHFFASTIDKTHRIIIPPEVRKHIFPEHRSFSKVMLVGRGNYFEVWPHEIYNPKKLSEQDSNLIDRIIENKPS